MPPRKQAGCSMKNNVNKAMLQDCIETSDAMRTAACGIIALGELMIAADPELIEHYTLSGLGHLLTLVASSMFDDSDRGSKTARSVSASANKSKRARKALLKKQTA
jgi:hypothetical protein